MTRAVTILTSARERAASTRATYPRAAIVVAALSVAGAAIHLYVVPVHREEWWVFAAFFVVVAIGQVLSAVVVLWWPRSQLLVVTAAANVAVIVLWVVSRTSGLPVGPPVLDMTGGLADPARGGYGGHAPGLPEPVGFLDAASTLLELLVVVGLVQLLPAALRRHTGNAVLLVGTALWVLYLIGVLD